MFGDKYCIVTDNSFYFLIIPGSTGLLWNAFDLEYWKCKLKRYNVCPDEDIKIFLYSP